MAEPGVTVAILTFNGETYLEELLEAIERQHFDGGVDVLVIDSGSTDRTLEVVRAHPAVRLIEIPNSQFQHGATRNLAARESRGRYIAYLTQDAIPADEHWLAELVAPFALDERVALVTGRQIPRPTAFPLQRFEIEGAFRGLGPDDAVTLYGDGPERDDRALRGRAAFHSDVNAAVRTDLVLGTIPFREVPYAEDQLMGKDVLEAGLLKAYAGRAAVIHSNDLTLRDYGRRIVDETVGLRRIGFPIAPLGRRAQLTLTLRGIVGDSLRIVRAPDYSVVRKLRWLVVNPWFQVRKWSRYRVASNVDLDDARLDKLSLERHRANKLSASD